MVYRLRGGAQIFVQDSFGVTFPLEVEGSDKVEEVKRRIEDRQGIPSSEQILVSGVGKQLRDSKQCLFHCSDALLIGIGRTLSDYNIFRAVSRTLKKQRQT